MSKQINFRADQRLLDELSSLTLENGTRTGTIETIIHSYAALRKEELRSLKGTFNEAEIKYLVDMLNSTIIDPQFAGKPELLAHEVEDADKYEGLGEKWAVDSQSLLEKVNSLSPGSCMFLQQEIRRWWDNQTGGENELDEFVKKLI